MLLVLERRVRVHRHVIEHRAPKIAFRVRVRAGRLAVEHEREVGRAGKPEKHVGGVAVDDDVVHPHGRACESHGDRLGHAPSVVRRVVPRSLVDLGRVNDGEGPA